MAGPDLIAWLRDHPGASQTEAIDHHWPTASPSERGRRMNSLRQQVWRARRAGTDRLPDPARGAVTTPAHRDDPPRPSDEDGTHEPRPEAAHGSYVAALETAVAAVAGDAAALRAARRYKDAALVTTTYQIGLRQQLEEARRASASTVRIERTPGALAREIERDRRAIELAAELARRREVREASEAVSLTRDRAL